MDQPQNENQPHQLPEVAPEYVKEPIDDPIDTHTSQPTAVAAIYNPKKSNLPDGQTFLYGKIPARVVCQYCNVPTDTRIQHENGVAVWLSCLGCVVIGCGLGCCLIPFCVDTVKDCHHVCGKCDRVIGQSKII